MTMRLIKFQSHLYHFENSKYMANDSKKTGKWLHEVDEAESAEQSQQAQQADWLDNSQEAIEDKQDSQK